MKKDKKYTDKELLFLDALFGPEAKGDVRKAMIIAGYSENTSSIHIIRNLRDEIIDAASQYLAAGSPLAVMELLNVLLEPNKLGASNSIKAAKEILDRAGLVKPETDVNLKVPEGGLVILPVKGSRLVTPIEEVSEEKLKIKIEETPEDDRNEEGALNSESVDKEEEI